MNTSFQFIFYIEIYVYWKYFNVIYLIFNLVIVFLILQRDEGTHPREELTWRNLYLGIRLRNFSSCVSQIAVDSTNNEPLWCAIAKLVGTKVNRVVIPSATYNKKVI